MPDQSEIDARWKRSLSRTLNDPLALPSLDRRSTWARRRRDLIRVLTQEVASRNKSLGEHHRLLINAAAAIAVRNEQLQIKIARGESDIDLEQLTRLSSTLSRLLAQLGLDRPQGPKAAPPPRLNTYFDRRR